MGGGGYFVRFCPVLGDGFRVVGCRCRVDRAGLKTGVRTQSVAYVVGGELVIVVTSDAACVMEGALRGQASQTTAELKGQLEEVAGIHILEVSFLESGFDTVEVQAEFGQFLFVGWEESLLKLLELELLESPDLILMFSVPFPESGFGDVDFEGDGGKAPAVGAQGDEGGKFW